MPSRKMQAAVAQREMPAEKNSQHNASTVRFSTVPPDPTVARMQEDIRAASDKLLLGTPFKNGTILTVDFNTSLSQELPHHLDGAVGGFIVCDLTGSGSAVSVYRESVDMSRADTHIKFRATAACVAQLWCWR